MSKTLAYVRAPQGKWKVLDAFRCEESASSCASDLAEQLGQSFLTLAIVQPFEEKFATQVFYVDEEQDISLVKQFYVKDETELEERLKDIPEPSFVMNNGLVYPEGIERLPLPSFRQTQKELEDMIFRPVSASSSSSSVVTVAPPKSAPKGKGSQIENEKEFQIRMEQHLIQFIIEVSEKVQDIAGREKDNIYFKYKEEFKFQPNAVKKTDLSIDEKTVIKFLTPSFDRPLITTERLDAISNVPINLADEYSDSEFFDDAVELAVIQYIASNNSYDEDSECWLQFPLQKISEARMGDIIPFDDFQFGDRKQEQLLLQNGFGWAKVTIPYGSNGVWLVNQGGSMAFIIPPCSELQVIEEMKGDTLVFTLLPRKTVEILTLKYMVDLMLMQQFLKKVRVGRLEKPKAIEILKDLRCVYPITDKQPIKALSVKGLQYQQTEGKTTDDENFENNYFNKIAPLKQQDFLNYIQKTAKRLTNGGYTDAKNRFDDVNTWIANDFKYSVPKITIDPITFDKIQEILLQTHSNYINNVKDDGYAATNNRLQLLTNSPELIKNVTLGQYANIAILQYLVLNNSYDKDIVVWRWLADRQAQAIDSGNKEKVQEGLQNKALYQQVKYALDTPGSTLTFVPFTSTSLSEQKAREFASGIKQDLKDINPKTGKVNICCLMKIIIPAGHPALYIEGISEREVLLPPCTQVQVMNREKGNENIINLRVVQNDFKKTKSILSDSNISRLISLIYYKYFFSAVPPFPVEFQSPSWPTERLKLLRCEKKQTALSARNIQIKK